MNILRQYIKQILLEALRDEWNLGIGDKTDGAKSRAAADLDLKKWFHQNADQKSLQRLEYIHWTSRQGAIDLLLTLAGGKHNKNEISTSIHNPAEGVPTPFDHGRSAEKIGIVIRGFVSMASNVDMDSGNVGAFLSNPEGELPEEMDQETKQKALDWKKTSGIAKRPNTASMKHGLEDDWSDFSRISDNLEGLMILKAEDFIHRDSDTLEDNRAMDNQRWPEAILDNWRATEIIVPDASMIWDDQELIDALNQSGVGNAMDYNGRDLI